MSIDLDWETLTGGPDGEALADRIKTFIDEKFQTITLPRFIKSVQVRGFDFGDIPPVLELKDITDPLPEFYEQEVDDEDEEDEDEVDEEVKPRQRAHFQDPRSTDISTAHQNPPRRKERPGGLPAHLFRSEQGGFDLGTPFLGASTPGILSGPGFNYFQAHLGTGTQTPLAAVAGAHLGSSSWAGASPDEEGEEEPQSPDHDRNLLQSSISAETIGSPGPRHFPIRSLREKSSVSTLAPTAIGASRPPTRDTSHMNESAIDEEEYGEAAISENMQPRKEPRVEDVQAVFRIRYAGDVKLNLTAEILLDYPMPSFVGIPVKLNITGLTFDGVGVLANIRKRVHFCFLSPEDALAAVGRDDNDAEHGEQTGQHGGGNSGQSHGTKPRFGGLLQEIRVESEIGQREGGKQSLKNVGKVERFVMEQVGRIFEEEFVYPSFWTFLV